MKQACDHCRRRKRRCSGDKPKCTLCQRSGVECTFTYRVKRRGPKPGTRSALQKRVADLEEQLDEMREAKRARTSAWAPSSSSSSASSAAAAASSVSLQVSSAQPTSLLPAPLATQSQVEYYRSVLRETLSLDSLSTLQSAPGQPSMETRLRNIHRSFFHSTNRLIFPFVADEGAFMQALTLAKRRHLLNDAAAYPQIMVDPLADPSVANEHKKTLLRRDLALALQYNAILAIGATTSRDAREERLMRFFFRRARFVADILLDFIDFEAARGLILIGYLAGGANRMNRSRAYLLAARESLTQIKAARDANRHMRQGPSQEDFDHICMLCDVLTFEAQMQPDKFFASSVSQPDPKLSTRVASSAASSSSPVPSPRLSSATLSPLSDTPVSPDTHTSSASEPDDFTTSASTLLANAMSVASSSSSSSAPSASSSSASSSPPNTAAVAVEMTMACQGCEVPGGIFKMPRMTPSPLPLPLALEQKHPPRAGSNHWLTVRTNFLALIFEVTDLHDFIKTEVGLTPLDKFIKGSGAQGYIQRLQQLHHRLDLLQTLTEDTQHMIDIMRAHVYRWSMPRSKYYIQAVTSSRRAIAQLNNLSYFACPFMAYAFYSTCVTLIESTPSLVPVGLRVLFNTAERWPLALAPYKAVQKLVSARFPPNPRATSVPMHRNLYARMLPKSLRAQAPFFQPSMQYAQSQMRPPMPALRVITDLDSLSSSDSGDVSAPSAAAAAAAAANAATAAATGLDTGSPRFPISAPNNSGDNSLLCSFSPRSPGLRFDDLGDFGAAFSPRMMDNF